MFSNKHQPNHFFFVSSADNSPQQIAKYFAVYQNLRFQKTFI